MLPVPLERLAFLSAMVPTLLERGGGDRNETLTSQGGPELWESKGDL